MGTTKRWCSSESAHGSSTSHGFSNDTIVRLWDTKQARDNYVANSSNLSCRAIPISKATKEAANYSLTQNRDVKPNTFYGEYWGINNYGDLPTGCIGILEVFRQHDNYPRFYN